MAHSNDAIKTSNELYPATGDKILALAEYIHDSNWTESIEKDLKSINALINRKVNASINNINNLLEASQYNNVYMLEESLEGIGGIEITKHSSSENPIQYNENGEITSINPITVGLIDNLASYLEVPSAKYQQYIVGRVRGDIDGNGVADISDATALINALLYGSSSGINIDLSNVSINMIFDDINHDWEYIKDYFSDTATDPGSVGFKITIESYNISTVSEESGLVNTEINSDESKIEKFIKINNTHNKLSGNTIDTEQSSTVYTLNDIYQNLESNDSLKLYGYTYLIIVNNNSTTLIVLDSSNTTISDPIVVKVNIDDPDGVFLSDTEYSGSVDISDATTLINYLLYDTWPNDDLLESGLFLRKLNENNNFVNVTVHPGIVYLAFLSGKAEPLYFMAKQEDPTGRIYPMKFGEFNLTGEFLNELASSAILNIKNSTEPEYKYNYNNIINYRNKFITRFTTTDFGEDSNSSPSNSIEPLPIYNQQASLQEILLEIANGPERRTDDYPAGTYKEFIMDNNNDTVQMNIFIKNKSGIVPDCKVELITDYPVELYNNITNDIVDEVYIYNMQKIDDLNNIYRIQINVKLLDLSALSDTKTIENVTYNTLSSPVSLSLTYSTEHLGYLTSSTLDFNLLKQM